MKKSVFRAVAAAATIAFPFNAISQSVGVTTAVRNTVQVRQAAGAQSKPAVIKQRVSLGNQVDTGAQSAMQVMLFDKSTFTVGPNAKFTINSFVYDPSRQRSSVASSVAKGTFRMLSGKAAHGGNNTISTPAATIGIRGTMVEGSVGADAVAIARSQRGFAGAPRNDPATASLIVLRGPGPNTQAGERPGVIEVTAGGRTIILTQPGMAIYVPYAGAEPMGPFPLSPRGFAFFDAVLRTAPASFAGTLAALQSTTPGAVGTSMGSLAANAGTRSGTAAGGTRASGSRLGRLGTGVRGPILALTLGPLGVYGLVRAFSSRTRTVSP
jgi:FecR protein